MERLSHLSTICSSPSSSSSLCTPYASSYNFHISKPHLGFNFNYFPLQKPRKQKKKQQQEGFFLGVSLCSPRSCLLSIKEKEKEKENEKEKEVVLMNIPKLDKSGRFCSPRAARELALMIVYASCLEGSDPVRLFEKRINARREIGYQFDKESLLEYNHMTFGGPPVTTESREEADELLRCDEKESAIEAEVLSAPPKLVYSKLLLRFARKLLVAVVEKWDSHVLVIDKVAPVVWKNEPAGRILELCILHLAMSEITVLGTRHQIVINEAVDLAKRFCDGAAPRIINGCLRTFMKDFSEAAAPQNIPSRR